MRRLSQSGQLLPYRNRQAKVKAAVAECSDARIKVLVMVVAKQAANTPASVERRIVKVLTLLLFAYWKG
jgi:hypothetical protein